MKVVFVFLFLLINYRGYSQSEVVNIQVLSKTIVHTKIATYNFSTLNMGLTPDYYYLNTDLIFKINTNESKIIKIFNDAILIVPGDTINITIEGTDIPVVKGADSLNIILRKWVSVFDSIGGSFFRVHQFKFNPDEYILLLQNAKSKADMEINRVTKDKDSVNFNIKTVLINYLSSIMLFKMSYPFLSKNVSKNIRYEYFNYLHKYIISDTNYSNIGEFYSLAILNIYARSRILNVTESFWQLLNNPVWNDLHISVKALVSISFIKAFKEFALPLTKIEINQIDSILNINDTVKNHYYDYFSNNTKYIDIDYHTLFEGDILLRADRVTISSEQIFDVKEVYIYFWASWCLPCIKFIKGIDFERFYKLQTTDRKIIFISVDKGDDEWLIRNRLLQIPTDFSYRLKKGMLSNFCQKLNINSVPTYLHLKNGFIELSDNTFEFFEKLKIK